MSKGPVKCCPRTFMTQKGLLQGQEGFANWKDTGQILLENGLPNVWAPRCQGFDTNKAEFFGPLLCPDSTAHPTYGHAAQVWRCLHLG